MLRVEIEQYKINSGDKINIEFLSPASRERKLLEIDEDLAEYYEEHRGSSQLKPDEKGIQERRRLASAMGVRNVDIDTIHKIPQQDLADYMDQRESYLNQ